MPFVRTVHLARRRLLPQDGGDTVFCVMTSDGRPHGVLGYLEPGRYPEFEGEEAWFKVLWHSKRHQEFLEQIEAPAWAVTAKKPSRSWRSLFAPLLRSPWCSEAFGAND